MRNLVDHHMRESNRGAFHRFNATEEHGDVTALVGHGICKCVRPVFLRCPRRQFDEDGCLRRFASRFPCLPLQGDADISQHPGSQFLCMGPDHVPLDGLDSQANCELPPGFTPVRHGVRHPNHQRHPRDRHYSHPVVTPSRCAQGIGGVVPAFPTKMAPPPPQTMPYFTCR